MKEWVELFREFLERIDSRAHPLQYYIILIFSISVVTIYFLSLIHYNPITAISSQYHKYLVNKKTTFSPDQYGVLVCSFVGEKTYKNSLSHDLSSTLDQRFRSLRLEKSVAKHYQTTNTVENITTPNEAYLIGKKYKADLVIWGSITARGTLPNIMIINNAVHPITTKTTNLAFIKDSLNNALTDPAMKALSYPELTDDPLAIIALTIANNYMEMKNYDAAEKSYKKAIPSQNSTLLVNNIPILQKIYINIAICQFYKGAFKAAEQTLVKHTDYINNENLLSIIGCLRVITSQTNGIISKKIARILTKYSPKDWQFLEAAYLLGISDDIPNTNATDKKRPDEVDKKLEILMNKDNNDLTSGFLYYKIQQLANKKDIDRFRRLYKILYSTGQLEQKIILTLLALNVDISLAQESVESLTSKHKPISSLTLLNVIISEAKGNIEKAKELLESDQELSQKSIIGKTIFARYFIKKTNLSKALEYYDQIIARQPDISVYRKDRGNVLYELGKTEKAEYDYDRYLKENPHDTIISYKMFQEAASKNDQEGMKKYFSFLAETKQDSAISFDEIIRQILTGEERAKDLNFPTIKDYETLKTGFNYLNNNNLERAIQFFTEKANKTWYRDDGDKTAGLYYYALALLNILDTNFLAATRCMVFSYVMYPTNESFSKISSVNRQFETTKTKTTGIESENKDLYSELLKLQIESYIGDKLLTDRLYDKAMNNFPSFCYLMIKAGIYYRYNRHNLMVSDKYLVSAMQCNSEMNDINKYYGRTLLRKEKYKDAIGYFDKSLEIDGESEIAYEGLSRCYKELGDRKKDIFYYKKFQKMFLNRGGNPIDLFRIRTTQ